MKKIAALIIMTAVIISCFTGCGGKTAGFDDLENLAISAALSYRTLVWNGSMDTDTPEFAWNTAGWYAAYIANLELSDDAALSEDQLKDIQNVILPGEAVMTPPDDINAEAETRDGKTYWKFTEINDDLHSYLGVISEVNCEKAQNNSYVVTIRDHLRFDVVEETVFNIGFKEENDSYILSEFSRNEFIDLDFTTDMLYDANHLSNLFSIYDNLTITEDHSSGYGSFVYSRKTDNGYTLWTDDGSSGYYDEFRFYTSDNATGKVSVTPDGTSSDCLDDYIAITRLPDEGADLIRLTCTEEEEIFYVDYGFSSTVYTIDRGTLALKKTESFDENDESYFMAKFSYGDKLPEPDTIAAWKGPLRTVSLKLLYSDGETLGLSFTIPADWEFDVYEYCPWGTAYLDEGCTELYEYPGDGIDYTIYVCEGAE